MSTETVFIIDGARTPMGGLMGALSSVPAPDLAATSIREALSRARVTGSDIDEVFMGCVLPAGLKQCPARQSAIGAGIPNATGAVTVNKACGSGMQASIFGIDSIRAGSNRAVVAGGMESMSRAPHLMPAARAGVRLGPATLVDHMFVDGLEDAYTGRAMGTFAQETADARSISREAMDAFAIESLSAPSAPSRTGHSPRRFPRSPSPTARAKRWSAMTNSPTRPRSTRFRICGPCSTGTARSPRQTPVRYPTAPVRW